MNSAAEIWKPIEGFEGIYEVSSLGRVKTLARRGRRQTKIMAPRANTKGYLMVGLYGTPDKGGRLVSRLVCHAFKGASPGKAYECAHINGDKLDNRAENLQWIPVRENNWHKREHGTMVLGEQCHMARLTETQVLEIVKRSGDGESDRQLAKHFDVTPSTIHSIINGRTWGYLTGIKADKSRVAELLAENSLLALRAEAGENRALAAEARVAELEKALADIVAAFVNPHDGGEFEAGEVPVLDAARAVLSR